MQLSEDQILIQEMASAFSRDQIQPFAATWEKTGTIPETVLRQMGELGLLGMTVSPDWDGAGTDYTSYALALMEIAKGDGGLSTLMSVNNSPVCSVLESNGSPEQKERFLRPLARGEHIGSFCLTEPQAGSDASMISTSAKRDGNGYVLNGTKQFITSGRIASTAIIFAVTDPSAGKKGISAFVVDTKTKGYAVGKAEEKLGQKTSDTCQITFTDMRIDGDSLIGEEGDGYRIALANLETGRIGIAAQSVGMAEAAFVCAKDYAQERTSFGKKIVDHQAVAFRLADMATKLEAAKQLTLSAAAKKDAGKPCLKEACMAKLFASEVAEQVCSDAIQTLGGYGYLAEYPVEKIYRDVKVCQIYEGTSDIQKIVISRALINES